MVKHRGLTPKQLEIRKGVLGGTDAAAVLGLSRWRNAFDVYAEKVGDAPGSPHEMSPEMLWGLVLEDPIRQYYAELHERKVRKPRGLIRHEKQRWLAGHIDGDAGDRGLEIKTARWPGDWGESGSDQIPAGYKAQVWHYMAVTGKRLWDVAVLIGGSDYREYTLEWKPEIEDMVAELHDWWHAHVVPRVPPEWDGTTSASRYLRRTYPADDGSTLVALPHQYDPLREYAKAKQRADLWANQVTMYEQVIQSVMGPAKKLESPILTATWSTVKAREKVSWKTYAESLERLVGELATGEYGIKDDPLQTVANLRSLYTEDVESTRRFSVKMHQQLLEGEG